MAAALENKVWGKIVEPPKPFEKFIINAHGCMTNEDIVIPDWLTVHFVNKEGTTCNPIESEISTIHSILCQKNVDVRKLKTLFESKLDHEKVNKENKTMKNYRLEPDSGRRFESNLLKCSADGIENIHDYDNPMLVLGRNVPKKSELTLKSIIDKLTIIKTTDNVHIYCLFCRTPDESCKRPLFTKPATADKARKYYIVYDNN
jgi:hypothetical protein